MEIGLSPRVGQGPVAQPPAALLDHAGDRHLQRRRRGNRRRQQQIKVQRQLASVADDAMRRQVVARLRPQAVPVILQPIEVPVAGRGQIDLPVGPLPLDSPEALETGGGPEAVQARRCGDRRRPVHRLDRSGQPQAEQKAPAIPADLPPQLEGRRRGAAIEGTQLEALGNGLVHQRPAARSALRSLIMPRIRASWASMLSVSRNCTRARCRL